MIKIVILLHMSLLWIGTFYQGRLASLSTLANHLLSLILNLRLQVFIYIAISIVKYIYILNMTSQSTIHKFFCYYIYFFFFIFFNISIFTIFTFMSKLITFFSWRFLKMFTSRLTRFATINEFHLIFDTSLVRCFTRFFIHLFHVFIHFRISISPLELCSYHFYKKLLFHLL